LFRLDDPVDGKVTELEGGHHGVVSPDVSSGERLDQRRGPEHALPRGHNPSSRATEGSAATQGRRHDTCLDRRGAARLATTPGETPPMRAGHDHPPGLRKAKARYSFSPRANAACSSLPPVRTNANSAKVRRKRRGAC